MNNLEDNFLNELEKLSEYFSYEMEIDEAMAPVFKFKQKSTEKEYSYRLSVVKMLNELKSIIREYKINDLGL